FEARINAAIQRWKTQMAPYKGLKVVTYHRSWANFADAFALDVIGYVEPKPGIPPTPQHTLDVINAMKAQNIKIILVEPYFDSKTPNSIASNTGGKVLVMTPSVGGVPEAADYFKLFDYDIGLLTAAIKETGAKGRHGHDDASVPGRAVRRQPDSHRYSRLPRRARRRAGGHLRGPLARADRGA